MVSDGSSESDKPEFVCAKLLMDSLKLFDDSLMTDQHIIDIMHNVKCIAIDFEHFPKHTFFGVRNDMEVEEFINEWKRSYEAVQFDTRTRAHLFTSLAGKIGYACRRTLYNFLRSYNII